MFSELERLEGYYQIMGFLNGVKEVFSIGSTLDRMNQGIDGVVNYKSCSVENFFESQYGTINTIVSGGADDIRFKVLRAHIAIAINDGFPVIVLHQGNPYIGSRLRNEFGGVVETNIVDIGSACYDPFYDLDGGAISELVMGAAPKSFDIKHNAKYYIEGVEGKRTMVPCMTEELEHKFYGSEPVFMYDPTDDSNRPVKGVHTNAIRRWPIYPEYIREAFVKAFSKNSMNGTTPRIIEKEWQELLTRMRDDLAICEHCGNETFVHYDREMICINCGKPVKVSYSLKTSRYNVPLLKGKYLYKCHTDASSEDFKTITVEIKTKKTDPSVIGLKNVSGLNWIVNNADGTILNVKNGDMLTVQKGMEIMMGSTKTVVQ